MTIARRKRNDVRGAFTLMELMVVIAIIVVLAGIGGYAYMNSLENAKGDSARAQVKGVLTMACKDYKLKHGEFPAQLRDLLEPRDTIPAMLESEDALIDPWNQPYRYDANGTRNNRNAPDIWTVRPDTGEEIGNWPKGH